MIALNTLAGHLAHIASAGDGSLLVYLYSPDRSSAEEAGFGLTFGEALNLALQLNELGARMAIDLGGHPDDL